MERTPKIFLSYAHEDEEKVSDLYQQLSAAGFQPWMDIRDIVYGEIWERSIRRALLSSDFFLACLSLNSISKRGFLKKEEWQVALRIRRKIPESTSYLIPARLEPCNIPRGMRSFQTLDLFKENGFESLRKAIQSGMEDRKPHDMLEVQGRDPRIIIQGALVLPIYPNLGVDVLARLYQGNDTTVIRKEKIAELEEALGIDLQVDRRTLYRGGDLQPVYDLGFLFSGGQIFSAEHGFLSPSDWPFEAEDVWLGRDITDQFSLIFGSEGTPSVRRRRRR